MEGKIRIAGTVGESIVDGPGFRYTLFVQGCPHGCPGCHNPQTHDFDGGQDIALDTLLKDMCKNPFVKGVTFSGGEPLMQSEFLYELLTKTRPLHRAVETSGYARPQVFERIIEICDLVIMDLKLADRTAHKKYTGVYNDIILENLRRLRKSGREHIIRIPLIPSITDTEQNLRAAAKLVRDSPVELLRYNAAAGAKYETIGKKYTLDGLKEQKTMPDISMFERVKIL